MKHPAEALRNFNKTDDEMLLQSEVQLSLFNENKSRFTDFFPQLAGPFADEWAAAINTARGILPDYASLSQQANQTDLLALRMDEGRNLFQSLILYARLAFPGDTTIMRLLGQSQYDTARKSPLKMPILLHTANIQASRPEIKSGLIASGMKETDIVMLATLAEQITSQDLAQEKAKKERSLDTTLRIHAMNAVWEKMVLVSQCAKLVFQNNASLYSMFLLDDGSSPKVPAEPPAPAAEVV